MFSKTRMLCAIMCVICVVYTHSPRAYGQKDTPEGSVIGTETDYADDSRDNDRYAYGYTSRNKRLFAAKSQKKPKKLTNCQRAVYHHVARGETLYKIAKKYKISFSSLCQVNNFSKSHRVKVGEKVKLRSCHKQASLISGKKIQEKFEPRKRPSFQWPLKYVVCYKRDGAKGIRPIGIIIKGRPHDAVFSSAEGIVMRVGRMRGFGKYVVVKHKGRYTTVYAHLAGISVSLGDSLKKGARIGNTMSTLHFQIDYAGKPLNPLTLLPKKS